MLIVGKRLSWQIRFVQISPKSVLSAVKLATGYTDLPLDHRSRFLPEGGAIGGSISPCRGLLTLDSRCPARGGLAGHLHRVSAFVVWYEQNKPPEVAVFRGILSCKQ